MRKPQIYAHILRKEMESRVIAIVSQGSTLDEALQGLGNFESRKQEGCDLKKWTRRSWVKVYVCEAVGMTTTSIVLYTFLVVCLFASFCLICFRLPKFVP